MFQCIDEGASQSAGCFLRPVARQRENNRGRKRELHSAGNLGLGFRVLEGIFFDTVAFIYLVARAG